VVAPAWAVHIRFQTCLFPTNHPVGIGINLRIVEILSGSAAADVVIIFSFPLIIICTKGAERIGGLGRAGAVSQVMMAV